MPSAFAMLLATVLCGVIAGAEASTFIAAAIAAVLATWISRIPHYSARQLFANLDPLAPDGAILLLAVRKALALIPQNHRPVLIRIAAFATPPQPVFRLNINREGDLEICRDGCRPWTLKHPGVWIADHPLPLFLPHDRCLTLRLAAAGKERVRSSLAPTSPFPNGFRIAVVFLAVAACTCDIGWLLAAALGFACQAYLLEHHAYRPDEKPKIQP